MDFVGYAALGGLERVTIVAGAIIIGYWGYRLYTGEKKAGLVFMGLAVLVLVGALATGNSHLKSVGEGMQLASAAPPEMAPPAPEPPAAEGPSPFAVPAAVSPAPAPVDQAETETSEPADASAATPAAEGTPPAVATSESEPESPVRLATGQELGGRIVSVKSENVSLEWSSDSD